MAPSVTEGHIIKIELPTLFFSFVSIDQDEVLFTLLQLAKSFISSLASLFFDGSNQCYMASYVYINQDVAVLLVFLGGNHVDNLVTNNCEDENYLPRELQDYLQEALYDYLCMVGEELTLEHCKVVTVTLSDH